MAAWRCEISPLELKKKKFQHSKTILYLREAM